MNCTIKREELIQAIDLLTMIPSRPGIGTSEFICFHHSKNNLKLMMTSEVSGYAELKVSQWPFDKDIYIDRRLFDPFVSAAKNISSKSNFEFSKSESKELTVINGSRKGKFTCADRKKGYDNLKFTGSHEVKAERHLNELILAAKHCAEQETAVPELGCVYLVRKQKELLIYATNSLLVFRAEVKSKLKLKQPLPFPIYLIDMLADNRLVGIEATKHEVILDFGIGKIWQTIAVAANNKFPRKKIDERITEERKTATEAFTIEAKAFGSIVQRLAGYLDSVRRMDWVITLRGNKGSHRIELEIPLGHTTFKDKLKVKSKVKKDFDVDWPFDRCIGVLTTIANSQDKVTVSFDKENRAYLRTSQIELLIPRRVN